LPSTNKQNRLDQQRYKIRRNASLSLNIKYASFFIYNKDILNRYNPQSVTNLLNSLNKDEIELLDWLEAKIKEVLV